jgi:chemotaxis protein CheX
MDQTLNAGQERVQIHLSVRAASPDSRAAGRASGEARSAVSREGWRDVLANATCEVFEIMVGTSLGRAIGESPYVVADFTAMVGIAGSLCGVFGLRASSESARRMAANMLGSDEVGANENVQDAFGEICNMIAGNFKAKIAGMADGCALSVPTVISGKDYALYSLANGERFEVMFSFEGHPLSVTLDLHS